MKHGGKLSRAELRRFGWVMAGPLTLLGGWFWWRGSAVAPWLFAAAAAFAVTATVIPGVLAPVERAWMRLAWVMSAVMTRVILTLSFFLVITPFGWLLKLLGKDLLDLERDPARESYWMPVEEDGPATRPEKPY